jgi:nitroimidazol reductase NimA-like FMN-containing flavoprotein (pyridoxamine 5'-phosphate oxidase superfamily)
MLAEAEKESAEWDKLIKQSAEEVSAPDPDQAILDHLVERVKEVCKTLRMPNKRNETWLKRSKCFT